MTVSSIDGERVLSIMSLLFVKAHFYTHLLEPSKKMFAWEDCYIIHCSGASAMLLRTCRVLIEVTVDQWYFPPGHNLRDSTNAPERVER